MKTYLFFTVFLSCNITFSQAVLHLPAKFRDSNYLQIAIGEKLSEVASHSDFVFSGTDSNCSLKSYYYNVSFSPGKTVSGQINALVCKKEKGYAITVDKNNNKNFTDDSTATVFAEPNRNKYFFTVSPSTSTTGKENVLDLGISLISIKTTKSDGSSRNDLLWQLIHKNSIYASFNLGKYLYHVEAIPKYLNNGSGEASIGFSEPNKEIDKMDIADNIIPHRLRNDTIISGPYKFIIDSVDFIHNIISLTSWPMSKEDYGYKVSDRIRNYSLSSLNDTSKKTPFKKLFQTSDYLLVDFWGSWCQPCLKNLPRLQEMYQRSRRQSLNIIGIACERTDTPSLAINALKKLNVEYDNFFLNTNKRREQKIINDLDVFAYPTYILLNKNLQIVMRETNEEGLEKIEKFLNLATR